MADIVLHGCHRNTRVTAARLVLAAKGVEFLFHDTQATLHPFDRMPVLTHGDFTVWETPAIAAYVDDAFCGPALAPANAQDRARMNQWISAADGYFYPCTAADGQPLSEALSRLEQALDVLERTLGSGFAFLAGERVSLADYLMLPLLLALGGSDAGRGQLMRVPVTIAWIARMALLPAVAAVAVAMPPRTPATHRAVF